MLAADLPAMLSTTRSAHGARRAKDKE